MRNRERKYLQLSAISHKLRMQIQTDKIQAGIGLLFVPVIPDNNDVEKSLTVTLT